MIVPLLCVVGFVAQLVECTVRIREAPGSKPGESTFFFKFYCPSDKFARIFLWKEWETRRPLQQRPKLLKKGL